MDELQKLSYTWDSAGEITTVTWTLSKDAEETKAREDAIEGAKYGWTSMSDKFEKVLAEL